MNSSAAQPAASWLQSGERTQLIFVDPVAAMVQAQSAPARSTPIAAMAAETYVETLTPLLQETKSQLYAVLDLYDDLSKQGKLTASRYN